MNEELNFKRATRRLLFKEEKKVPFEDIIPGAGTSAASAPERHLKVKVTMNLDGDVVNHFKRSALEDGRPYQSLINQVLREYIEGSKPERLAKDIGQILLKDSNFLKAINISLGKDDKGK